MLRVSTHTDFHHSLIAWFLKKLSSPRFCTQRMRELSVYIHSNLKLLLGWRRSSVQIADSRRRRYLVFHAVPGVNTRFRAPSTHGHSSLYEQAVKLVHWASCTEQFSDIALNRIWSNWHPLIRVWATPVLWKSIVSLFCTQDLEEWPHINCKIWSVHRQQSLWAWAYYSYS